MTPMKKKLSILVLLLALFSSLSFLNAQEDTIIFVTDDNLERDHIEFLERQGFVVIKYWPPDYQIYTQPTEVIDWLNEADLVIFGRSGPSSSFMDDNRPVWNGLTAPVMCICPWKARSHRLNLFNSTFAEHLSEKPPVLYADVLEPGDPVFSGVTVEGDTMEWFSHAPHDVLRLDQPTNGTILAAYDGGDPLFVRFDPDVPYYPGAADSSAGPRTYFGMGNDNTPGIVNFFSLSKDAQKVYLAEICRLMGIPAKEIKYGPTVFDIVFVSPNDNEIRNIEVLEKQGFNITKYWPAEDRVSLEPQETIDWLAGQDLIIIGRSGFSSNFQDPADRAIWHGFTSPQILLSPYTARSSRMRWFNSWDVYTHWDTLPTVIGTVSNPDDPIFDNIELEGNTLEWINPPNDYLYLTAATNGNVIVSENTNVPFLVRFDANIPFYEGSDTARGPRTYIGMGNDFVTGFPQYFSLTWEGKMVYVNEICRLLGIEGFMPRIEKGANVSGTWTQANSPYYIDKNLTIPDNATLVIEPGVEIRFMGYYFLLVHGTLIAEGEQGDSILFTINDKQYGYNIYGWDLNSELGAWQGIYFENFGQMEDNDTSVIKHCIIEYAKSTKYAYRLNGGAINIDNTGKVRIENSVIRYNSSIELGGGIALDYRAPVLLKNSYIFDNTARDGGGLYIGNASLARVENNTFYRNIANSYGGGIRVIGSQATILNNIIANNYAGNNGGGVNAAESFDKYLGNLIVNNECPGEGGGMDIYRCSPYIINNTIAYNRSTGWYGGGIAMYSTGTPKIINSIIWGNSALDSAQLSVGNLAIPDIYNSIIQGGRDSIHAQSNHKFYGNYVNNLDVDPLFRKPPSGAGNLFNGLDTDWSADTASQSLNNGSNELAEEILELTDVYGNPRVHYAIIDIGAVETRIGALNVGGEITCDTSWIADTIHVWSDIYIRDSATLTISPGAVVLFQGYYGIYNEGVLIAKGAPDRMIKFTIHDPTGHDNFESTQGSWKGIVINNSDHGDGVWGAMTDNDTTYLEYCILEYANNWNRSMHDRWGGAMQILNFSKVVVDHCVFQHNIGEVGGGLCVTFYSGPRITNNTFYENWSLNDGGGIMVAENSWPLIANNIISNNKSDNYAGGIHVNRASPVIVNNVVCNNHAMNVGGVNIVQSEPEFVNNTVVNNRAGSWIGGMEITNGSPEIVNSIFWGNEDGGGNIQLSMSDRPEFYNCMIERLTEGGIAPWDYSGTLVDMVTGDPDFTSPTGGAGNLDYNGLEADWSITNFSPLINAGKNQDPDLYPEGKDIAGYPRVNDGTVDIGPYENSAGLLSITQQPLNQVVCEGNSARLSVKADGPAKYRWLKDEVELEEADSSVLYLEPAVFEDAGNYSCEVYNGYGSVISNNVRLDVIIPPEIMVQSESQWFIEDATLKLDVISGGSEPIKHQWFKDGNLIADETLPQLKLDSLSFTDEGTYVCRIQNSCGSVQTSPITLFMAPQICMVTVDTATGDNLVIWEKNSLAPILNYNIYRESIVAGQYEPIGQVPAGELSVFLDPGANPAIQAFTYKITATRPDGSQSDISLCKPHKTIHLLTSYNTEYETAQLSWDHYYGFVYGTFFIFRSTTEYGFSIIHQMASSTTAWTDIYADPDQEYYYRVAVEHLPACQPTGTGAKVGTGPYHHSLSNMDDNKLKLLSARGVKQPSGLVIHPNPVADRAVILFRNPGNEPYRLSIMDLSGKVVYRVDDIYTDQIEFTRGDLPSGLYLVELRGPDVMRGRMMIR